MTIHYNDFGSLVVPTFCFVILEKSNEDYLATIDDTLKLVELCLIQVVVLPFRGQQANFLRRKCMYLVKQC